jgi:solute:Na+ symporter, SSS family
MRLTTLDWAVVSVYAVLAVGTGLYFARRAGQETEEFFLAGRSMPWWLLGTSMVATTFSTDTPNLVTDLVRTGGVSQNWLWWAFVLTGMMTVFFYARLWRRSAVLTDLGFYELRYSGRPAAFLRGFRAVYLGVFFNTMIMATVTLAAIKIGGVLLGASKYEVVLIAGAATALYSATSGLWGVVVTDLMLFAVAMFGSLAAAYFALAQPEVGGLVGLFSHPALDGKLSMLPDFTDWRTAAAVFIVPIAVQWWSTWYPGAEPGGGGYVAQRMLAARDESHALKATLWFNVAHYALRPWPWIIVALASLIVYPTLESIQARLPPRRPVDRPQRPRLSRDARVPAVRAARPRRRLARRRLHVDHQHPPELGRLVRGGRRLPALPGARPHRAALRAVGRAATVGLIVLASAVGLWLENALQAFQILLQIGAGTGLVFLLRWFWWRINAWSELSAMVISFLVAIYFQFVHGALGLPAIDPSMQLVIGVLVTTAGWLTVTFLTPPADAATLGRSTSASGPWGPGGGARGSSPTRTRAAPPPRSWPGSSGAS